MLVPAMKTAAPTAPEDNLDAAIGNNGSDEKEMGGPCRIGNQPILLDHEKK
jgi:hypothetical protein